MEEARAAASRRIPEEEEDGFLVFNVEKGIETEGCDWPSYRRFIDDARRRASSFYSSGPTLKLDIILRTYSQEMRLWKLKLFSDCELVGYQMDRPLSQWLEFGYHHSWRRHPPEHQIPGSSFLELDTRNNYSVLLNAIREGMGLGDILFGQRQLVTAVNLLATSMDRRHRAWALIIVITMICHAIMSPALADYLAVHSSYSRPLSEQILCLMQFRCSCFFEEGPSTARHCLADYALGEDDGFPVDVEKEHRVSSFGYSSQVLFEPRCLVEVFSVLVNRINGETSGNFYGTISASAGGRSSTHQLIYNREKESSEFIRSGDNLLLTGPSECIAARHPFRAHFDFVFLGKKIPSPYYSIALADWGEQDWGDHTIFNWDRYGQPLWDEFVTDDCSIMASFIVFKKAVQATLEVTINTAAYIYGEISASSSNFLNDCTSVLFRKTAKEHMKVCHGELLKLSRAVVAVPWESILMIRVDLYDYEGEFAVAKGVLKFPCKLFGSSEKSLFHNTEIRVKVTLS